MVTKGTRRMQRGRTMSELGFRFSFSSLLFSSLSTLSYKTTTVGYGSMGPFLFHES